MIKENVSVLNWLTHKTQKKRQLKYRELVSHPKRLNTATKKPKIWVTITFNPHSYKLCNLKDAFH